jgi:uncharacterized protein (TIGR00730 family)
MSNVPSRPGRAYKNLEFLTGPDARAIRIIYEYIEPQSRFRDGNIQRTIVFFGSARLQSKDESLEKIEGINRAIEAQPDRESELLQQLKNAEHQLLMSNYYEEAVEIARLLTEWSSTLPPADQLVVCSGGGAGIMEAANRGAACAGGKSIGLNISLPDNQTPNPYISPKLSFEFHYFFMRKLWFVDLAEALLIFPGGFGTLDELMEILTLVQTGKIRKQIPIIIYGTDYWNEVINFEAMVKWGTISEADLDLFRFTNTPQETVEFLKQKIRRSGDSAAAKKGV